MISPKGQRGVLKDQPLFSFPFPLLPFAAGIALALPAALAFALAVPLPLLRSAGSAVETGDLGLGGWQEGPVLGHLRLTPLICCSPLGSELCKSIQGHGLREPQKFVWVNMRQNSFFISVDSH